MKYFAAFALTAAIGTILSASSHACTRVVYKGPNATVITARSMDWKSEIDPNIWIFPRGMRRNGAVGPKSVEWTSKYGSVITSAWDMATTDGMNEKGLVANILWLAESEYPKFDPAGDTPGISISLWAQYLLDNFATVSEAVDYMASEPFAIVSDYIPGTSKFTTLHLSISDAGGDCAIFEYIDGKQVIHHDPSYVVMTNSPSFEQQLTLDTYWKYIPGTMVLPGTNRATDRFVRASYYIDAIPKTDDIRTAVASVFSVIRNCSVPFGISSESEPNISSTRWRSLSDQKRRVYYFETTLTPDIFWVDLTDFDLGENAPVMKLDLAGFATYDGKANASFKPSEPFKFMGLQ